MWGVSLCCEGVVVGWGGVVPQASDLFLSSGIPNETDRRSISQCFTVLMRKQWHGFALIFVAAVPRTILYSEPRLTNMRRIFEAPNSDSKFPEGESRDVPSCRCLKGEFWIWSWLLFSLPTLTTLSRNNVNDSCSKRV